MCGKNTTTTSTSMPSPQAEAAYSALLPQAQGVSQLPFVPYGGEFVAPVNQQEQLAGANINQSAGFASPFIQQAATYANQAAAPITAGQIQNYMNPYINNVVGATEAQFNQQNQIQQNQLTGNAAAQGALGGDRVGLAQAALAGQQQMAEAPTIAGLYSQGYGTALQTALAEQQAQAQGAYSLGNLGVAGQNAALQGAGAQLGYGQLQQGTQQQLDAAQYAQFLAQQGYPFQTTQWLAGIDTGVGSQMGGTNVTQGPAPNPLNSILGLGALGLGALSDRRAKESVSKIGHTNDGQPIYRFRYKGDPEWHISLMAQDVEKRHPGAVHAGFGGLKHVDLKSATDDAVGRHYGGKIPGFAMGGMPYSSLDNGGESYVPSIGLTVGNTMPKGGSSGQQQQNPIQNANQLLGLAKSGKGLFNSGSGDVSTNDAIQAGLDSGMDPEDFGPGVLEDFGEAGFRYGGPIAGFAEGGMAQKRNKYFGDRLDWDKQATVEDRRQYDGRPELMRLRDTLGSMGLPVAHHDELVPGRLEHDAGIDDVRSQYAGFSMGGVPGFDDGGDVPADDSFDDRFNAAFGPSRDPEPQPEPQHDFAPPQAVGLVAPPEAPESAAPQPSLAGPPPVQQVIGVAPASETFNGDLSGQPQAGFGQPQAGFGQPLTPEQSAPVIGSRGLVSPGSSMVPMDQAAHAIGKFESGGNYGLVGTPTHGGVALGKYQIMSQYLPEYLRKAGLPPMSAHDFLNSPETQDAVFHRVFGQLQEKYGNFNDAASVWFSGKPASQAGGVRDALGTSVPQYLANTNAILRHDAGGGDETQTAGLGTSRGLTAFAPTEGDGSGATAWQNSAPFAGGSQAATAPSTDAHGKQAGMGGFNPFGLSDNARMALIAGGLGMMASTSPYLGPAIGQGGLQAIQAYQSGSKRAFDEDLALKKLDQAATNSKNLLDYRNKSLEIQRERLEQGHYQFTPGFGPGPNGQSVYGAWKIDSKTGKNEFVPNMVLNPKGGAATVPLPAEAWSAHGDEFLRYLPPDKQGIVKGVADYTVDPKSLSVTGGHREEAMSLAKQYDPNFDQKTYNERYNAVNRFSTGKQGDTVRSLNVGIEHLGTLEELSDALGNTGTPAFNAAANWLSTQTGHPAPTNFNLAKQIVADEVMKAVVGGGAGSADERKHLQDQFNAAGSPAQLKGAIVTAEKLMAGQVKGLRTQYKASTGLDDAHFDKLLDEKTRGIMSGLEAPARSGPTAPVAGPANLPGGRPAPGGDPLAAARDAIARGAPRDAVIKRLQQNGIDPTGL